MIATVNLYSEQKGEINKFLNKFYNTSFDLENSSNWEKQYKNPIELAEIIGAYIDNSDDYLLNMLICLDKNVFIHITNENADKIIRYLFERYPY